MKGARSGGSAAARGAGRGREAPVRANEIVRPADDELDAGAGAVRARREMERLFV